MTTARKSVDRRAFLQGRLGADRAIAPAGEIASILVQARPERLDEVETAITALSGCEIYGRDAKGKLVVVIDAADAGALGSALNAIALIPHVYSACLVFHAVEAGQATSSSAAEKFR
jgi:nitrate reductase NapD